MRVKLRLPAVLVAGVIVSSAVPLWEASAQAPTIESVVDSFYPTFLVDLAEESGRPPVREQCFEVLAVDAAGEPTTIFATHSDRHTGVIRVLRKAAAGFDVVAEPTGLELGGAACEVKLVDFNRDNQKEIHLSFVGARNSADWLFGWNGQDLTTLNPTEDTGFGTASSRLNNIDFVDIDGDGILELSSLTFGGAADQVPDRSTVYRWSSGQFVETDPAIGPWIFVREGGTPKTVRIPFDRGLSAQGPFSLLAINGTGTSGTRVENAVNSARVWLNGQEILGPSDFGTHVATIGRTVILQAENELTVRLAGSPGGTVTIIIKPASWIAP